MCPFSQDVAREAKGAIVASRTTSNPATVVHPSGGAISWQLLDLAVNCQFLALAGGASKFFEESLTLFGVFLNHYDALFLALDHASFCHGCCAF